MVGIGAQVTRQTLARFRGSMRQLRLVGWAWVVVGAVTALASLLVAVAAMRQGSGGGPVTAGWAMFVVCGLASYAGLGLRHREIGARVMVGLISAYLGSIVLMGGPAALELGSRVVQGSALQTYAVMGLAILAELFFVYSLGVAVFAGRAKPATDEELT